MVKRNLPFLEDDVPLPMKNLNPKSIGKGTIVVFSILLTGGLLMVAIAMINPQNNNEVVAPPTESEIAKAQLDQRREDLIKGIVTTNFNPQNVMANEAGLLQLAVIQRAAELREWIDVQRNTPSGVHFGKTFPAVVWELAQSNNVEMINAQGGLVNQVRIVTTITGKQVSVVPTPTQRLMESIVQALALQHLTLDNTAQVPERRVENFLIAQSNYFEAWAKYLTSTGNNDAVNQIRRSQTNQLIQGGIKGDESP